MHRRLTRVLLMVGALVTPMVSCVGTIGDAASDGSGGGGAPEACSEEGEQQSCYPGPAGTEDVGECRAGTAICQGGFWTPCIGAVVPQPELCDGRDYDCDGTEDTGCGCANGSTKGCYTGPTETRGVGECSDGTQTCEQNNWSSVCVGEVLPGVESCDGVDNDCNGILDDGCACVDGATQACYTGAAGTAGIGVCSEGEQQCQDGQWPTSCPGQVTPTAEQCDGEDDDCDGQTDEDNPGGGASCNTGLLGVCAVGTRTCVNGTLECESVTPPSAEQCDGEDNDCNGQTDEGCCDDVALSATAALNPGGGTIAPYNAAAMVNGQGENCNQYGWMSNSLTAPGWATLSWTSPVTVGAIYVDGEHASAPACGTGGRDIRLADVQYLDAQSQWVTAGSLQNAENYWFVFPTPVQTRGLRLNNVLSSSGNGNTIIHEWYAFAGTTCPTPTPN